MLNIHTSGIKKKECTNVSQQLEIDTYCPMNKQYAKRDKNKWIDEGK